MERKDSDAPVIELGSVSAETRGDSGIYLEGFARQPNQTGISDE